MSSGMGSLERAIRNYLCEGLELLSPGRGYPPRAQEPFKIFAVSNTGIRISKLAQEIRFDALEKTVSRMRSSGGEVEIGSQQSGSRPGTLERFLKDANGNDTRTSTYVAPILVESRIAEYLPKPGAKRIRLTPQYMETTP